MSRTNLAALLMSVVAAVQCLIAAVEMFLWQRPRIHRRLDFTADEARKVAPIVANAGLYNAFLAAGLVWALLAGSATPGVGPFFLSCVIVAGLFGAVTLKPTTLVLQTLPASAALAALLLARS